MLFIAPGRDSSLQMRAQASTRLEKSTNVDRLENSRANLSCGMGECGAAGCLEGKRFALKMPLICAPTAASDSELLGNEM